MKCYQCNCEEKSELDNLSNNENFIYFCLKCEKQINDSDWKKYNDKDISN